MKKLFAILSAVLVLFSFIACQNGTPDDINDIDSTDSIDTTPPTDTVTDDSQGTAEDPITPTEITVTLDNWDEYFEVYEKAEWQINDFREAENLRIVQYVGLKSEYREIVDIYDSSVAFEIKATKINVDITLDLINETFSYTDTINATYEFVETTTVTGGESSFFSCCDGYFTKNGAKIPNVETLQDIVISRVEGKIYLYEQ